MKLIKYENAMKGTDLDECKTLEYSFEDKDIDLGVATITGRYPKKGFCVNCISKELIYVLEGSGEVYLKDKCITFSKGDSILIENNEKYYWNSSYCKIAMTCTPAWNKEQYKIILED